VLSREAEPLVYRPPAGDRSLAFPLTDSLVVATWNVHVGGGDLPAFVADLRSGRWTGGASPSAFVVLLQEVHRSEGARPTEAALRPGEVEAVPPLHYAPPSGNRQDIVTVARELGLHLAYAPAVPNGRPSDADPFEDRGVAILSSHALDRVRVIELPRERQRRVVLVGTFQGYGFDGTPWSLDLASVHLENRSDWGRFFDSFGAGRARQARFLASRLDLGPTILGGDLNTWAPSFMEPTLDILGRLFPDTPQAEGATYHVGGLGRRLDHLMARLGGDASARAQVVEQYYGSDHRPVVGVVEVASPRAPIQVTIEGA
jgi:endonuclease/exonuclease/phosphatase family metal-dependent hydrolase